MYWVRGKSYEFSSGSFSFTNLVLANATNHAQTVKHEKRELKIELKKSEN